MDFQLASDLHLETRGGIHAPPSAYPAPHSPLLVLAGDVYPAAAPEYKEVIRRVAEPFQLVLYVPGNHEFYGCPVPMDAAEARMREQCNSLSNVVYFNQASVRLGDTQFLGATMWTNPTHHTWAAGAQDISDYRFICGKKGAALTPRDTCAIHTRHCEWLAHALRRAKRDRLAKRAVVITHHAPSMALSEQTVSRQPSLFPFYFSTDLTQFLQDPFITAWCFGHTHESYQAEPQTCGGPSFHTNALGYPGEHTNYAPNGVVKIRTN